MTCLAEARRRKTGEQVPLEALLEYKSLFAFLSELWLKPQSAKSQPPLLILDQFEELFTAHRDRWQDAQGFFVQVSEALNRLPRLGVVFAMREDHVAELDPYAALMPGRLGARFRMERLGHQAALEAVTKPAENAGCPFTSDAAKRLVDDLRRIKVQRRAGTKQELPLGPFVEPVQLQIVCSRLWENLPDQEDKTIQWDEVDKYGNVDSALIGFYEDALAKSAPLAPSLTEYQLRDWFGKKLITPIQTRGLVLRGDEEMEGLPNAAVDVLESLHLIRAEARAGALWYELIHDRLVDPILDSNRAWEMNKSAAAPALYDLFGEDSSFDAKFKDFTDRLIRVLNDVIGDLQVRTYIIDSPDTGTHSSTDQQPLDQVKLVASTRIKLDGDTEVYLPLGDNREIDQKLWQYQTEMVKIVLENRIQFAQALAELGTWLLGYQRKD